MPDRVEIARQVHVNYRGHPPEHAPPDFRQSAMRRPLGSKSVGVRTKVRLEDRFEDQFQRPLDHPVSDARNLKNTDFPLSFRDLDFPVFPGLVVSRDEFFPDGRQEQVQPCRFDIGKGLAVDARRSLVPFGNLVGFSQRSPSS